jgi:class 3 adenylate cyclase
MPIMQRLKPRTHWQKLMLNGELESKLTCFGINIGKVVASDVGSTERINYTAIGDHVNLTNRLQDLSKLYKTTIIVSEHTYSLVKDHFKFRLLDRVAVKGKKHWVYIYEWSVALDLLATHQPFGMAYGMLITLEAEKIAFNEKYF